jgi:hypothetical protein
MTARGLRRKHSVLQLVRLELLRLFGSVAFWKKLKAW